MSDHMVVWVNVHLRWWAMPAMHLVGAAFLAGLINEARAESLIHLVAKKAQ